MCFSVSGQTPKHVFLSVVGSTPLPPPSPRVLFNAWGIGPKHVCFDCFSEVQVLFCFCHLGSRACSIWEDPSRGVAPPFFGALGSCDQCSGALQGSVGSSRRSGVASSLQKRHSRARTRSSTSTKARLDRGIVRISSARRVMKATVYPQPDSAIPSNCRRRAKGVVDEETVAVVAVPIPHPNAVSKSDDSSDDGAVPMPLYRRCCSALLPLHSLRSRLSRPTSDPTRRIRHRPIEGYNI